MQGRLVRSIMHEFREAGTHGSTWDGRMQSGQFARNGLYFLRLRTPEGRMLSQRITLAR